MQTRSLWAAIVVAQLFVGTARAATVYFTDIAGAENSVIRRVGGDGANPIVIVPNASHPRGISIDVASGKFYWADSGTGSIRRANLDGTANEKVADVPDIGGGVALDLMARKIYWSTSINSRAIRRANLDGTQIEDVVTVGQDDPSALAVDNLHSKLYWTDLVGKNDGLGFIRRSNLDGSNVETIVSSIDEPTGLACDAPDGKIYWTDTATKKVQRANLDGTGLEDLVTNLNGPTSIALDLTVGRMYWTDSDSFIGIPRILKATLDGRNVQAVLADGFPWGIAVAPGPEVQLIRAVKPALSNLEPGIKYQLQLSSDLNVWTNQGDPFIATAAAMEYPQYWDVDNWAKLFFRVQVAP
jgi:sugar lactone lactonase YvrE